jgi:hypothetical protein
LLFGFFFFNVWFTGFVGGFSISIFGEKSFIIANLVFNTGFIFQQINEINSSKINAQQRSQIAELLKIIGFIILIVGFLINLILIKSFLLFVVTTILGIISIYFGRINLSQKAPMIQTFLIKQSQLQEWQNKWHRINGLQEKLLPSTLSRNQNIVTNSELTNYSFDRLIVCEKADIVHFLIANNFHLEHNCAILSITGYPENIFQTILDMAKQNPNLKVYALHDCSSRGISLINSLRTSANWFLNSSVQIYDLGLSYAQIMKIPNAFIIKGSKSEQTQLPFEVRQNLASEEIQWFENGHYVELESFSPKFLLKVVKKGISQTNQAQLSDKWAESDGVSDTDLIIFSADSFG